MRCRRSCTRLLSTRSLPHFMPLKFGSSTPPWYNIVVSNHVKVYAARKPTQPAPHLTSTLNRHTNCATRSVLARCRTGLLCIALQPGKACLYPWFEREIKGPRICRAMAQLQWLSGGITARRQHGQMTRIQAHCD